MYAMQVKQMLERRLRRDKKGKNYMYHYTNIDALIKIISNKELWLSNIFQTNDPYDGLWIIELIRKYLPQYYINYNYHDMDQYQGTGCVSTGNSSQYVCSFSKEKDLLSQWRGYGNNGKGVAICFDEIKILHMIQEIKPSLIGSLDYITVNYNEDEQVNIIKEMAMSINLLNTNLSKNDYNNLFTNIISKYSAFFKQKGFYEEQEMRLVFKPNWEPSVSIKNDYLVRQDEKYMPKIYYRESLNRNDIIPYYKLKLFDQSVLTGIILGPNCDVNEKILHGLLDESGFDWKNINIEKSIIQYR
jgi:hypothetical protein